MEDGLNFRPHLQFISNRPEEGKKVLATIESELKRCDSFCISVAFITDGGITPLLMTLRELEAKGIPGKMLTTNFLYFNKPKTLQRLAAFRNIELKIYDTDEAHSGFHTKGYIFQRSIEYTMIIGSANMTATALTKNKEWNTLLVTNREDAYTEEILGEFQELWDSPYAKAADTFIGEYARKRTLYQSSHQMIPSEVSPTQVADQKQPAFELVPNDMQLEVIKNFTHLYEKGASRGLLISATGTGKTYASAFAVKSVSPKRVLFLVHREQIAKQALRSYERVIGPGASYGIYSGNHRDSEADYIFATIQTMSKAEVYEQFDPNTFDLIVIDEAHRAGSITYSKIFDYFKPRFFFGMTASPERGDGFDIYKLFHHHIIHEIRLQEALAHDLLCPFHYFAISDLEIDGTSVDEGNLFTAFDTLVVDRRVEHVIEQARYFGYSGKRVKGLAFCSTNEEAKELSAAFNQRGYQTMSLSGSHSQEEREAAIYRLVSDDILAEEQLDYIFTVDIFNEGVDIPKVNQVLMLRPTESAIIFVQQLGRGLRKADDKEYVVVLDFIGNYQSNYLIPVALSGDRSFNKDHLRYYIQEGARIIPGSSTIHFDEVAKERIFNALDQAKFSSLKQLKEAYGEVKRKLGHSPSLREFVQYGTIDIELIVKSKLKSYYGLLRKVEKEDIPIYTEPQITMIDYIWQYFILGKRPHELWFLQALVKEMPDSMAYVKVKSAQYNLPCDENTIINLTNLMTNQFRTGSGKKTYELAQFIGESFRDALGDATFKAGIIEMIEVGLERFCTMYMAHRIEGRFCLYQKYTYEDVCRILDWKQGEVPLNIGGYKFDKDTKTYPVFINYHKEDVSDTINYEDKLLNDKSLQAISKGNRTLQSEDVQTALHAKELGVSMHLFIRKNKLDEDGAKEFYYLGPIHATGEVEEFTMPNTSNKAVKLYYELDYPIRSDLYDYLINY